MNNTTTTTTDYTTSSTGPRAGQRRAHSSTGARFTFAARVEFLRADARAASAGDRAAMARLEESASALAFDIHNGPASFAPGGAPPQPVSRAMAEVRERIAPNRPAIIAPNFDPLTAYAQLATVAKRTQHNSSMSDTVGFGHGLKLYDTVIVGLQSFQSTLITLSHGGHPTATTARRINQALSELRIPASITRSSRYVLPSCADPLDDVLTLEAHGATKYTPAIAEIGCEPISILVLRD